MTEVQADIPTNQVALNVQTPNGSLQFELKPDDSIAQLKEVIAARGV